jgi:hypothetical protein
VRDLCCHFPPGPALDNLSLMNCNSTIATFFTIWPRTLVTEWRVFSTWTSESATFEVEKRVLGAEHPDTLTSAGNLAWFLSTQGNYAEAERIQREVHGVRKHVLGAEHLDTLLSVGDLAQSLSNQGKAMHTALDAPIRSKPSSRTTSNASPWFNHGLDMTVEPFATYTSDTSHEFGRYPATDKTPFTYRIGAESVYPRSQTGTCISSCANSRPSSHPSAHVSERSPLPMARKLLRRQTGKTREPATHTAKPER